MCSVSSQLVGGATSNSAFPDEQDSQSWNFWLSWHRSWASSWASSQVYGEPLTPGFERIANKYRCLVCFGQPAQSRRNAIWHEDLPRHVLNVRRYFNTQSSNPGSSCKTEMGECDELLLVSDTDDVCGPAISSDPPDQLYLAEFLDLPRSVWNRFLEGSLMRRCRNMCLTTPALMQLSGRSANPALTCQITVRIWMDTVLMSVLLQNRATQRQNPLKVVRIWFFLFFFFAIVTEYHQQELLSLFRRCILIFLWWLWLIWRRLPWWSRTCCSMAWRQSGICRWPMGTMEFQGSELLSQVLSRWIVIIWRLAFVLSLGHSLITSHQNCPMKECGGV